MGKNIGVLVILLFTSNAMGIGLFSDLFEGFQKEAEYKSSIPCESKNEKDCAATLGTFGKALDTASKIGLDIQKIIIKPESQNDSNVYVETAQVGTCFVNTNSQDNAALKFSCSAKKLINDKLQGIDKVIVLKKENDEKFVLEDIPQKQSITR